MMPVVILAGGLGTRLGDITKTVPKALVEVNGEPFLAHQLRLLHAAGIREVVMCIGHLGRLIEEYAGDGGRFGIRLRYAYDGPHLLGTAGAIRRALPLLGGQFFTMYGDSYLTCDYAAVAAAFAAGRCLGLMTVHRNEDHWDTSNVEFAAGRIIAYDKNNRNDRMHHIDYGLGVFDHRAFERIPIDEPYDLATLYQDLLRDGQLAAHEITERFYEIGSTAGLQDLANHLAGRR